MSLDFHRRAEALMADADRFHALGQQEQAAAAYQSAATLELEAFRRIPTDRVRTRGIIAISAVSLYRQAGQLDEAVRTAYEALANLPADHPTWERLERLLDDVRNELSAARSHLKVAVDEFEWILKGGMVEIGQAPIELVLDKIRQVDRLGVRVFELLTRRPLRTRGAISPEVRSGFRMTVSQPAVGSFRFSTRFGVPSGQLALIPAQDSASLPIVDPDELSAAFDAILVASQDFDEDAMSAVVEDSGYREVFLRLLRDIAPDGRDIATLEVRRRGPGRDSAVFLRTGLRKLISERLAASRVTTAREVDQTAVLRAVDLNRGWIRLGPRGDETQWWVGRALVLEDVVEGLVNKSVHVVGHQQGQRLVIDDIEEAQPESTETKT